MPKPKKRFWNSLTRAIFPKLKLTDAHDPRTYIGHTVMARPELDQPDEKITILHIQGSLKHVKHFEINGSHWVSMHSFFVQMLEGRVPTKEEEDEFELATQITNIRSTDGKKEK